MPWPDTAAEAVRAWWSMDRSSSQAISAGGAFGEAGWDRPPRAATRTTTSERGTRVSRSGCRFTGEPRGLTAPVQPACPAVAVGAGPPDHGNTILPSERGDDRLPGPRPPPGHPRRPAADARLAPGGRVVRPGWVRLGVDRPGTHAALTRG